MSLIPFGVFALDGLELFKQLNDQFYIVHKESVLFKQIFDKQEKSIKLFQNQQVHDFVLKNEKQYPTQTALYNFVKFQNEKIRKNFETSAEFNSDHLAVPCDLNLDFFLAPKQWIEEIFFAKTFNFA